MKRKCEPNKDETLDFLSCCNLSILQKKRGYRYSLDSYLLAAFVDEAPGTEVIEIGSGSGVVSILLSAVKGLKVTGIEIQEDLAQMSRRSVEHSGLSDKVKITCCDIRDYSGPKVDAVVTNPPYRPVSTGRINPDRSKAIARHEIFLDLDVLLKKTYGLLRPMGRLYIVYPAWRVPDLLCAMRTGRIEPKRMRCVYTSPVRACEICLVCGVKGGGREFTIEGPLIVYNQDNSYHHDMEAIFEGLILPKSH
jgi:tRNA1Val (adenine37-N6)-methyltransferase